MLHPSSFRLLIHTIMFVRKRQMCGVAFLFATSVQVALKLILEMFHLVGGKRRNIRYGVTR